jgi:hypothetical protein
VVVVVEVVVVDVVVDDCVIGGVAVVWTVGGTDVDGGATVSACRAPSAGEVSATTDPIAAVEEAGSPGSLATSMKTTDTTSSVPAATATGTLDRILE